MGKFDEMMIKMKELDRKARFDAKLEMMARHGIQQSDLEKDLWRFEEIGPFGKTVMRLYKLVDCIEVEVEGKVRSAVTTLPTANDKEKK